MPQLYIPQPQIQGLLNTLTTVENIKANRANQQLQQEQNQRAIQQEEFNRQLNQQALEVEQKANKLTNISKIYKYLGRDGRRKAMQEMSQITGIPLQTDKYDEFADAIDKLHKAEKEFKGDPKLLPQLAEQLLSPFVADQEFQPAIESAQQRVTGLATQQQQQEIQGAKIVAATKANDMLRRGATAREVRSYLIGTSLFKNEEINQIVGQKLGTPSLTKKESPATIATIEGLVNKGIAKDYAEAFQMIKTIGTMSREQFLLKAKLSVLNNPYLSTEEQDNAIKSASDWYNTVFADKTDTDTILSQLAKEYPPDQHKDEMFEDTDTGKRYISDGTKWQEVKP